MIRSIQMQLTRKCNQSCFMCRKYTWPQKEMDVKIVEEYLQKYPEATFTFSGGDPLSYSKLEELTRLLKLHKTKYQVFTNLNYDLTNEQIKFLDNADIIQVSFDGSTSVVYNSVRRPRENGFDVVVDNIARWFKSKKFDKLKLNATISNRNYFDVYNIWKFCKENGYNIRFFPVHTDEDAKLQPYMIKYIESEFINKLQDIPDNVMLLLNPRKDYKGKCFVKAHHLIVDEDGKCYHENILYDFCIECDRYRKFNENWNFYKNKEGLYL